MSHLVVVMGVSGCGKSTVAENLAVRMQGIFLDADDFHSAANKEKMGAGQPLNDEDRWEWLAAINAELKNHATSQRPVFLACSALRQVYRERISEGLINLRFIYLRGTLACITARLEKRINHFMHASLLASQFDILEEPADAVVLDIEQPIDVLVDEAQRALGFGKI